MSSCASGATPAAISKENDCEKKKKKKNHQKKFALTFSSWLSERVSSVEQAFNKMIGQRKHRVKQKLFRNSRKMIWHFLGHVGFFFFFFFFKKKTLTNQNHSLTFRFHHQSFVRLVKQLAKQLSSSANQLRLLFRIPDNLNERSDKLRPKPTKQDQIQFSLFFL